MKNHRHKYNYSQKQQKQRTRGRRTEAGGRYDGSGWGRRFTLAGGGRAVGTLAEDHEKPGHRQPHLLRHHAQHPTSSLQHHEFHVWLCLLGALALIWLALVLLLHLTPSAQGEQRETRNTRRSHLVWVVRTLASQSNPWMPLSGSRRVVTAAWLLACLIFLSSFSSTLTAMLTVPLVRLPIDSMEDLVGQTAIPWAIESGGFLYQILYTATDGLYKTIWDGHSARITDCYTFRQDIGDGKYAAICDKMTMKKVMSEDFSVRGECNYYMAREDFKAMPLALAFQHHHPFYSQANQRILELVNKGLVDRWIQEQLPNGTACLSPPGSDLVGAKRPLSLKDYYGLFSMFGICMLAWSLVLCVEVVLAAASSRSYRSFHSHLLARITKKNSYTNSTGSLSK
ncbi:glutamate receptor ionotropic, delta-2-like isoform X4 [Scylla paramamosain]|uniref:glutamate receptor ionotropic, delta-2-like isoform X4 n=1 Tax=Scylla paramamosain TaxID=85552 RepID=UPI003083E8CD